MNLLEENPVRKNRSTAPGRDRHNRNDPSSRGDCRKLNSRARRKFLRRQGLRRTITEWCGIMPLTEDDARVHRQLVKTRFFADLDKWERSSSGLAHFLTQEWTHLLLPLIGGFLAGIFFGHFSTWMVLATMLAISCWLREAINRQAEEKDNRRRSAQRIRTHAKWKIPQDWTGDHIEMEHLLSKHMAPEHLREATRRISARHPQARFRLEVFDEDPILWVMVDPPNLPREQYVLGIWGLPDTFTFR